MQYQLEIPESRRYYKRRPTIRHSVQTLFRLGIVLSNVCERSRDTHDIVSHAPPAGVTKAAGMRRDSNGNPIYSVFMQPAVRPSVTSTDGMQH